MKDNKDPQDIPTWLGFILIILALITAKVILGLDEIPHITSFPVNPPN